MVEDLLNKAAASSFNVFRFWGFLDIGNQDVSNSVDGNPRAKSFQVCDCANFRDACARNYLAVAQQMSRSCD
ncbi:MAG: hypothetical protein DMG69_06205 [Acidobacteria bacterium]|nr:MAG: hypothetical protein DMG69_06205 [Acidobacteriota bacterium]